MSDGVFKAPKAKKIVKSEDTPMSLIPTKRCRTSEDFFTFCNLILEYENYEAQKQEWMSDQACSRHSSSKGIGETVARSSVCHMEMRTKAGSPLDSTGSSTESIRSDGSATSSTTSLEDRKQTDVESDEDSYDLVTCFCLKPFAGRPMIECSECLTWVHLSCAKIRKSHIPDEFTCQRCKDAKISTRRSQRKDQDRVVTRDSSSESWTN